MNLCVRDDGAGFDPAATIPGNGKDNGNGIPGVRARAEEAGGHPTSTVDRTAPTLRAWVPYRQADDPEAAP